MRACASLSLSCECVCVSFGFTRNSREYLNESNSIISQTKIVFDEIDCHFGLLFNLNDANVVNRLTVIFWCGCVSWFWIVDYLTNGSIPSSWISRWVLSRCQKNERLLWSINQPSPIYFGRARVTLKTRNTTQKAKWFFLAAAAGCGCHLFTYAPLKFMCCICRRP